MVASSLPESIDEGLLLELILEFYGFNGQIKPISGERDKNFYFISIDGNEYVVKVSSLIDGKVSEYQAQALQHMANINPSLPIPRVVKTKGGDNQLVVNFNSTDSGVLRILTWLPGAPLGEHPLNHSLVEAVASVQTKITKSLNGFSHEAQKHQLVWDMEQAELLKEMMCVRSLGERYDYVAPIISDFIENKLDALAGMRRQVIHNDFNPHNILIDVSSNSVSGILDFGDIIESATVIDLSVALSYMIDIDKADPLENVLIYLSRYHIEIPLLNRELDLLFDLVKMRLAMILVISTWRASMHSDRHDYVMRNNLSSWFRLQALHRYDASLATKRFYQVCKK